MKSLNIINLLLLLCFMQANAAELKVRHRINWTLLSGVHQSGGMQYTFHSAVVKSEGVDALPYYTISQNLGDARIESVVVLPLKVRTVAAPKNLTDVPKSYAISWIYGYERKQPVIRISLLPLTAKNTQLELLEEFDVVITYTQISASSVLSFAKTGYASQSVLATGNWYKFSVTNTGVHRITKQQLEAVGINLTGVDPRTIKIYSNGPGMLPTLNSSPRIDDLKENPILIKGEGDGTFDQTDEILFFGKAQKDVWIYDSASQRYVHQTNVYTNQTMYFLTMGGGQGLRIQTTGSPNPTRTTNEFDNLYVYEKELVNLIKSGKRFMGEEFNRQLTQTFSVNLGNVNTSSSVYLVSSVAARSFSPSLFTVSVNGIPAISHSIASVGSNYTDPFASDADGLKATTIALNSSNVDITYAYNQPLQGSIGWLDFFELQSRNFLSFSGNQFVFRDKQSVISGGVTQYAIATTTANAQVWDVTDPTSPVANTIMTQNNTLSFSAAGNRLREFVIHAGNYLTPQYVEKVENQNIHGMNAMDYIIITHPLFASEANRLAQHHRTKHNVRVAVIPIQHIYNEFSSGVQDICAIRDMLRMFYKKANTVADIPKTVLLFGRASYDYKDIRPNNTNFVPTFESWQSFDPIRTYCSDDFFVLLDDNEGKWDQPFDQGFSGIKEFMDMSIGRLPATDVGNAAIMVNKSINYESNTEWGDWMNRMTFVSDDEDGAIHESQMEQLANFATNQYKTKTVQKIHIDAYPEQVTAGGVRNPQAQAEIVRSVERGCLLFNYTGHGGEVGLAAERILNTDDVQNWTNGGRLPIFITATCEFSRYDDPERFAAGELALINPNGGAIALYTTVRLVNSGSNFALNTYILNRIGYDSASQFQPRKSIGEIMRLSKNDYFFTDKNERNFSLLGDPGMFLAYPELGVKTTSINNTPVNTQAFDTLKAFSRITVKGVVTDLQGNIQSDFNGVVQPTVFDKPALYQTVRNNPSGYWGPNVNPMTFSMQNNVIYRGQATVQNGYFEFSFIVPKDISYQFGNGKISYYAHNSQLDANGFFTQIIVGGTADSIPPDNQGPIIALYMNDEKFANGGIVNQDPVLIAKIRDDNGINITNRGIGRDIQAVVNNDNMSATVLNDFFQATLNSYQEGEIRYKMKDLPPGKHSLKLGAWDTYNNYGEQIIDFVVASDENIALKNVLNYPNPFTTQTTFHFDHNKPGIPITVMVQVFTISGKLIKTMRTETVTNGNHFDQLVWDGRDEFGDGIGKGVYVYKVSLKSSDGKSAEEFQKLVILN